MTFESFVFEVQRKFGKIFLTSCDYSRGNEGTFVKRA